MKLHMPSHDHELLNIYIPYLLVFNSSMYALNYATPTPTPRTTVQQKNTIIISNSIQVWSQPIHLVLAFAHWFCKDHQRQCYPTVKISELMPVLNTVSSCMKGNSSGRHSHHSGTTGL